MLAEEGGAPLMPLWPARELAELCATGEWAGARADSIPLGVFRERWLTGLARDQTRLSIFPVAEGQSKVVTPARFELDLAEALAQLE